MYARVCAYIWQIGIRTHDQHTNGTQDTSGKGRRENLNIYVFSPALKKSTKKS